MRGWSHCAISLPIHSLSLLVRIFGTAGEEEEGERRGGDSEKIAPAFAAKKKRRWVGLGQSQALNVITTSCIGRRKK